MTFFIKNKWIGPSIFIAILAFTFIDRGGIPFLSHAIMIIGLFLMVLLALPHFKNVKKHSFSLPEIFYFLFFLSFAASLAFSKTPSYGLTELFTVAGGFLLFSLVTSGAFLQKDFKIFYFGLLAVLGASLLFGIYIYSYYPYERFVAQFMNFNKLYEVYPNDYANFLLLFAPLCLPLFNAKRKILKISAFILFSLAVSAFLLTASRGAFAALAGSVLVILACCFYLRHHLRDFTCANWKKGLLVIILAGLFTTGLVFVRSQHQELLKLSERIDVTGYEGGSGVRERLEFWGGALNIAKDRFWFGAGPASFKFFFPRFQKTFGIAQDQPHNLFLKLLAEDGIFALLSFILFLFFTAHAAIRAFHKQTNNKFLLPLCFAVLAVVASNVIDDTTNFVSIGLPLSGFLGYIVYKTKSSDQPYIKISLNLHKFLLVFLGALLCFVAAHEIRYNIFFKQGKALLGQGKIAEASQKLETAKRQFFPRDLYVYLGKIHQDPRRAYENFAAAVRKKDPENAELHFVYGDFLNKQGRRQEALKAFCAALQKDAKNSLKYYYACALRSLDAGQTVDRSILIDLLKTYTDLLEKNAHFTVLSENPEYANKIYTLLIQTAQNLQEQQSLYAEQMQFRQIWFDEQEKLRKKYATSYRHKESRKIF